MLAAVVRSGLTEAVHDGAVAVVDVSGNLVAWSGDIERTFYFRSAAKPFQAWVCQHLGAALRPPQLAVASASHDGDPIHIALVESMLNEAGLEESALGCPPGWPLSRDSYRRLAAAGHYQPRRIFHNCSGKHSAMLRACLAQGWPAAGYLDPGHRLQRAIGARIAEVTEWSGGPPGIDGCGAPVFPGNALSMARAFAKLAGDPALSPVFAAMHRYPALVSGTGNADAAIATWLAAAAKRGAEGCMGVAVAGRFGLMAKAWDGAMRGAEVGMLEALRQLGAVSPTAEAYLALWSRPTIYGGGRPVGAVEPLLHLEWA